FQDNNRPELNTGRATFHVTHVMNANAIYELPFGRDRKWLNGGGLTDRLVGGWQLGSIIAWQSGSPVSIVSGRGTFNRIGRSECGTPIGCNTAVTNLSVSQVQDLFGIYKLPDGRIFFIDPKVIDPATGRAVGADNLGNTAGFPGQVFFNPRAGEVGNLPILAFNGPSVFRMDLALSKKTRITGRYNIELKGEAFNLTNTPNFFAADQNINSTTFGRLTSVNTSGGINSRVIQLSARLNF
ncbi:MAG TPA: hypothetical protein VNJ04_00395, partial [Gemmatimonadaceae bacterium]|nr:hypothetical protein [Gemmatimonadaceae bacterium]